MTKRSPFFLIAKIAVLQGFFVLTVKHAPHGNEGIFLFLASCLMLVNYLLIKRIMRFRYYLFLMLFFFGSGFLQDTILIRLGLIKLDAVFPPLWFSTLWLVFLGYYGDVFDRMLSFPLWLSAILGAIGGSLAYYRGLSTLEVGIHPYLYPVIAAIWAVFMPVSLGLFRYFKLRSLRPERS